MRKHKESEWFKGLKTAEHLSRTGQQDRLRHLRRDHWHVNQEFFNGIEAYLHHCATRLKFNAWDEHHVASFSRSLVTT